MAPASGQVSANPPQSTANRGVSPTASPGATLQAVNGVTESGRRGEPITPRVWSMRQSARSPNSIPSVPTCSRRWKCSIRLSRSEVAISKASGSRIYLELTVEGAGETNCTNAPGLRWRHLVGFPGNRRVPRFHPPEHTANSGSTGRARRSRTQSQRSDHRPNWLRRRGFTAGRAAKPLQIHQR